jgi:CheY-like chemotaxis protein/HPt (histidine-containing phosphotransfer) domain-containing protein
LGYHADAVANGREVLEALRSIPYDLVLMDVQMPEMDGLEAARRLRLATDEVLNRSIPIIAMTARAMQGDREKCLAAGMNDYISKPVTPATLSRVLERWQAHVCVSDKTDTEATQQTCPENEPVFNEASLRERLMGDRSLVRVIIRGFLDDVPLQMAMLEAFLEKGNAMAVERQAHSIRGAAAVVGGDSLAQMATEIEQAGHRGDLEGVGDVVSELHNRFEQLEKAIKASHVLDAIEE